jgi:hypothetical protein
MGGVMADQLQCFGVAVGEDRDLSPIGQGGGEVAQLSVDADRQGSLRQTRTDCRGGIGAGGAPTQLQRFAVGQLDGDFRGRLDGAMLSTAQRGSAQEHLSAS